MDKNLHSIVINHGEQLRSLQESSGGADTTRIFLHDVVFFTPGDSTTVTMPNRDGDIEKALVVARPQDLVCISPDTHPDYLKYLAQLELGPSSQNIIRLTGGSPSRDDTCHAQSLLESPEILGEICSKIRRSGPIILEPYIITPECIRLANELQARTARTVQVSGKNIDLVNRCIQKHWVKNQARELGIPVAEGSAVAVERSPIKSPVDLRPLKEAVKRWSQLSGTVIIRSATDVLASTIIKVSKESDNLRNSLELIRQDTHSMYLIEPFYEVTVSPNILFHVEPEYGPIRCIGITDQRLSQNLAHQGNCFPSRSKTLDLMLNSAQRFSAWLQAKGFSGVVGYDFCEYIDPASGKPAHFFTEINPRVNGSLYPLSIMAHLYDPARNNAQYPVQVFLSAKWVKVGACSYAEFLAKHESLFYYPDRIMGIIPFNTSALDRNIVDLVVVGQSPSKVSKFFAMVQRNFISK